MIALDTYLPPLILPLRNFDILIINDNFECSSLKDANLKVLDVKENLTPAEIRLLGINHAEKSDYRYVIFTDIDDFFSKNRISLSITELKNFDFVYNELDLVDNKGKVVQEKALTKLGIKGAYDSYLDLVDKNIFGMSNTAARVEKLRNLYIPKEIIAVDWWIFSLLLLEGNKGGFIPEATTFYRQSDNNLVGMKKKLDENGLNLGIKIKRIHYQKILIYCKHHSLDGAEKIYTQKVDEINRLTEYLKDDEFRRRYIEAINKNYDKIYQGWWSDILSVKNWKKYNE